MGVGFEDHHFIQADGSIEDARNAIEFAERPDHAPFAIAKDNGNFPTAGYADTDCPKPN